MAKTIYANGDNAWAEWFDSIFVTNGGHKHDGVDADGHSSKVSLANAAHVTGILPLDNAGTFNQVNLQVHASDFTGPHSVSCRMFQQVSMMGAFQKLTHLFFDEFEATDGTGLYFRLSTVIPEAYWPAENVYHNVVVNTYNVLVHGIIAITTEGVVSFHIAEPITSPVTGTTFVNTWTAGVKGFKAFGVSYITE